MTAQMQNPGLAPRALRNPLRGRLRLSVTPIDRQTQLLASRFNLSPPLARDVASLCFGESSND